MRALHENSHHVDPSDRRRWLTVAPRIPLQPSRQPSVAIAPLAAPALSSRRAAPRDLEGFRRGCRRLRAASKTSLASGAELAVCTIASIVPPPRVARSSWRPSGTSAPPTCAIPLHHERDRQLVRLPDDFLGDHSSGRRDQVAHVSEHAPSGPPAARVTVGGSVHDVFDRVATVIGESKPDGAPGGRGGL